MSGTAEAGGPAHASSGLHVLYLTNQLPFPPHSGGQVREFQTLVALAREVAVELFAITPHFARDTAAISEARALSVQVTLFPTQPIPIEGPPPEIPERVWEYESAEADAAIADRLCSGEIDVVHVEGYFLTRHIPDACGVPLVLIEENVEYLLDEAQDRLGIGRGAPWEVSRDMERAAWRRATVIGSVSADDVEIMRRDVPEREPVLCPIGYDHLGVSLARAPTDTSTVSFIGNYSWTPTRDAANVLLREIWPRVAAARPRARLVLAGSGADDEMVRLSAAAGAEFLGPVSSVLPVLLETDVFVCPMRIGGGIKVKLVEALAAGCAIVTTPQSLRGMPIEVLQAVEIAEDPDELSATVVALLGDPLRRAELSRKALEAVVELPSWSDAVAALRGVWQRAALTHVAAQG